MIAAATAALIATLAAPAPVTFTVNNAAHVRPAHLARVEAAVEIQSQRMAGVWGSPAATFGPGGWPITLQDGPLAYPDDAGYHLLTPRPALFVDATYQPWSATFSHEVLETLVDPHGGRPEVCDPLDPESKLVRGVRVARWAGPTYFLDHGYEVTQ